MNEPPRGQPPELDAEPDDLEISDLRAAGRTESEEIGAATGRPVPRYLSVRRLARLGGAIGMLVLVSALLLYGIRSGALVGTVTVQAMLTPPLPTPVVRYPDLHGMQCLRDDAWSPDSQYFAYAGDASQGCGYGQYAPNLINIYRARDGVFMRQLAPDAAIFAALRQPLPPVAPPYATPAPDAPFLMYEFLLWSRDGQRLAVVFVFTQGNQAMLGVAVVRARDGAVERVVLGNALPPSVSTTSYAVFDLSSGAATAFPNPITGHSAAPGYAWSADGQLVPAAPGPAGAVGNPSGDARFSIWQPGSIALSMPNGSNRSGQAQAGVYVFNTQVVAWSPDGRYVAAFFLAGGRVQPSHTPAPDSGTLAQLNAANLPLLPLRDAGLDQALHHVLTRMDLANASSQSTAWIAYRPDGKAIALLDDQQDFAVYASGTGAALYPFRYLDLLPNTHNGDAWALRWSPDGTALLLPDGSLLHVGHPGR